MQQFDFFDMSNVRRMIAIRQLSFIGKIVRNSVEQIPSKLITFWIEHKRKPGRVSCNNLKSIVRNLQLLEPDADKVGSQTSWALRILDE